MEKKDLTEDDVHSPLGAGPSLSVPTKIQVYSTSVKGSPTSRRIRTTRLPPRSRVREHRPLRVFPRPPVTYLQRRTDLGRRPLNCQRFQRSSHTSDLVGFWPVPTRRHWFKSPCPSVSNGLVTTRTNVRTLYVNKLAIIYDRKATRSSLVCDSRDNVRDSESGVRRTRKVQGSHRFPSSRPFTSLHSVSTKILSHHVKGKTRVSNPRRKSSKCHLGQSLWYRSGREE